MSEVETRHPQYIEHSEEWDLMRHAHRGPTAIKQEAERYLPKPSGFNSQADGGVDMYAAYIARARFPDIIAPMLRGMVGLIHRQEAQIEMPDALHLLWERATAEGLPLEAFHRNITSELLLMGRYSILTEVDEDGFPFFAGYTTEALINWANERDFFVLDESGLKRDGYRWKEHKKHLELLLTDGRYTQKKHEGDSPEDLEIARRGNSGGMEVIPFVVSSPRDLSLDIGQSPLIGVARGCVTMFQLDADYRHQLYMSGQETLFIIGMEDALPEYVGASVTVGLPLGAEAKYVGPSGRTIENHRQAIQDAKEETIQSGMSLFDQQSGDESGEALRLRFGAQTATLTTIAQTSAQALETALRHAAVFMNLDPKTIVVKPNLRFVDSVMTPEAGRKLMELWLGRAISKLTLYENLQRGEIASPERSFEDEEELILKELLDPPIKQPPTEEEPDEEEEPLAEEEPVE